MVKKYPKIKYPSDKEVEGIFEDGTITIEEKLDGSNFRTKLIDGEICFGSRNTFGEDLQRDQFSNVINYINERVSVEDLIDVEEDYGKVTLFGEGMIPHTKEYNWEETPFFIGFDVWSDEEQIFLDRETVEDVFYRLGLPIVPKVDRVDAEDWEDYDFEVPETAYGEGKAEGVVIKNHSKGLYAKYKTEEFKEKNKKVFGDKSNNSMSDSEKMAYAYATNGRIEKIAHKLVDEGEYDSLKMEMMKDLPIRVIEDIADEEGRNILLNDRYEVDLGEFRNTVDSRCANVLKQMVQKKVRESMKP